MANIKTVTGRARLTPRKEPYWEHLGRHRYLGYRPSKTAKPGTWTARYRGNSARPTKALGDFSNTTDADRYDTAKKAAEEWFDHIERGGSVQAHTLRDAVIEYVKHICLEKGDTLSKDAESRLKRLVLSDNRLSETHLTKLTPNHIKVWRQALLKPRDDGSLKAKSTINRDMTALRAVLNFAYRTGWVTSDFAWKTALQPLDKADKRRDIYLSSDERKKLVSCCASDVAPFVQCLCLLPLRPGVPAKLEVRDFDPQRGVLRIEIDKAGAGRSISLPPTLVNFFTEQVKNKPPDSYIFTRRDGEQWTRHVWKDRIKSASKAAGLPDGTVLYSLRHSTITDLIVNGLDLMTVSRISGTSIAMIQKHYGHMTENRARDALSILAA